MSLETAEVIKVRDLVLQVSRDQSVPDDAAEDARVTIRSICKEASRFGLTTADVVRAVFRPALEERTVHCNCPTCRSRRERLEQDCLLHHDFPKDFPKDDLADPTPTS